MQPKARLGLRNSKMICRANIRMTFIVYIGYCIIQTMISRAVPQEAEFNLLEELGERLRLARRRRRRTAEEVAARTGITRVTLRRVESGEPTVMMGTYLKVMAELGLAQDLVLVARDDAYGRRLQDQALQRKPRSLPRKIRLADFPMLRELAWSTDPGASITPEEALALYERNWRHLDPQAMEPKERALVERLTATVGKGVLLV